MLLFQARVERAIRKFLENRMQAGAVERRRRDGDDALVALHLGADDRRRDIVVADVARAFSALALPSASLFGPDVHERNLRRLLRALERLHGRVDVVPVDRPDVVEAPRREQRLRILPAGLARLQIVVQRAE